MINLDNWIVIELLYLLITLIYWIFNYEILEERSYNWFDKWLIICYDIFHIVWELNKIGINPVSFSFFQSVIGIKTGTTTPRITDYRLLSSIILTIIYFLFPFLLPIVLEAFIPWLLIIQNSVPTSIIAKLH